MFMLNIPVILGSVREGRKSIYPANFLVKKLQEAGCQSELVDFKVLPLPFLNCEKEPSQYKKQYPDPNVQKWSTIADAAQGFVIVTPEYNHGYSAVLKNALDWLYSEFENKPVGLVGVSSGRFGAVRAIEQLRPIMGNFGMFDIKQTVPIGPVKEAFNEQGELINEIYIKQIDGLISNLMAAANALSNVRKS